MECGFIVMQYQTSTLPERRRLTFGLVLSLTIHAILLSIAFHGQGFRLSGVDLPWQNSGAELPDLQVVLLPAPTPSVEQ